MGLGLFPCACKKPVPCVAPGAGSKEFPLISIKSLEKWCLTQVHHGPSVLQVEELSQMEVDVEEKMGRADQSLAQVKGVSSRMRWWIGPFFLDFPLLLCPGGSQHHLASLVAGGDGWAVRGGGDEEPAFVPPWQWSLQRRQHPWVLVLQAASQGKLGAPGALPGALPGCPASHLPWSCYTTVSPVTPVL